MGHQNGLPDAIAYANAHGGDIVLPVFRLGVTGAEYGKPIPVSEAAKAIARLAPKDYTWEAGK